MIGPCPASSSCSPLRTYRAPDFVRAAARLGRRGGRRLRGARQALAGATWATGRWWSRSTSPRPRPTLIVALDERRAVDAVVAVDDRGVMVGRRPRASGSASRTTRPSAVAATRDKAAMRRALAAAEVPAARVRGGRRRRRCPTWPSSAPVVVKPVDRSGSQGVIRADDADRRAPPPPRIRAIADGPLLVEQYVPGVEVAVEGLLRDGELEVLAVFDKPDPLDGPVLRGDDLRHAVAPRPDGARARVPTSPRAPCAALGLVEGPVHAELRVDGDRVLRDRGRGALDRRALLAHAALRRGHLARGADPAPRARHAARRPRRASPARRA